MESLKIQALTYLWGIWSRRWLCLRGRMGSLRHWVGRRRSNGRQIPGRSQGLHQLPRSLMGPLLKGLTVSSDVDNQIQIMLKTLISRPNLSRLYAQPTCGG